MDSLGLKEAGDAAWALVTQANQYIVQTAPWALAKAGRDEELDQALAALARCLYRLTVMASPFLPGKAQLLWQALGQPGTAAGSRWDAAEQPPTAGIRTEKPPALFPRPGVETAS
jgi:methionyl-tRNA synthetase